MTKVSTYMGDNPSNEQDVIYTVAKEGDNKGKRTKYTRNNDLTNVTPLPYLTKNARKTLSKRVSYKDCITYGNTKLTSSDSLSYNAPRPKSIRYKESKQVSTYTTTFVSKVIENLDIKNTVDAMATLDGLKKSLTPTVDTIKTLLYAFSGKVHTDTIKDRLEWSCISHNYKKCLRGDEVALKYAISILINVGVLLEDPHYTHNNKKSKVRRYRYSDLVIDQHNSEDNKTNKGQRKRSIARIYTLSSPTKNNNGQWVKGNNEGSKKKVVAEGINKSSTKSYNVLCQGKNEGIVVRSGNGEEYVMDEQYIDVDYMVNRLIYGIAPPKMGLTKRFTR